MSSESVNQIQQAADLPRERVHFKELLLADHFKLAPSEAGPPQGNTTYEQLVCIGYRPQLKRLDGVVQIKQSGGYSGGICTAGSQEYVRFFASTDNGAHLDRSRAHVVHGLGRPRVRSRSTSMSAFRSISPPRAART